jgi:ribonuclease E
MTVVDVNTGKFTGSGGNLEETVTKNNLEAAEEMVRQLRLRDIGGIIVIDFIDMVLESNRDLVLRRLVECLGRDRTRHQVAEVTSLGLVQMTRKRIGTGLLEAFSTDCEHCKGRGLVLHDHPVESGGGKQDDEPRGRRNRGGRNRGRGGSGDDNGDRNGSGGAAVKPSPADLANSRPPEKQADEPETQPEAQPETAAEEQPEKSVIGKPGSTAPEPQQVPTESGAKDDVASPAPEPTPEPTPVPDPDPESAPEEPRLVTSTRRRTARRPAGPPPTPVGATAPTGPAGPGAAGPPSTPSAEPVDIPVEPGAPGHTPVAEPDPRAPEETATPIHGDPTWPDESERPAGSSDESEQEKEDDHDSGVSLTHVPIKRKGSRKR